MRTAMASCDVGDDVFGDDLTVILLEARVAKMFEHEGGVMLLELLCELVT